MDKNDWGIRSGLEIHQQLDTHKLFCECPSVLRSDEPEFEVRRKLHAVAGESGEIDEAARYEVSKDREFVYQGYDSNCLVELDEEPPHPLNEEALLTGLHIALLLNCEIFPVAQIMRKTVVDGSNTSGFQRTVLIARKGYVESESGRVGVDTIMLEEDAARIIEKRKENGKETAVYRLDRLGIPLVEIATSPDIKSAEQAKEVALHIGDLLRSCKVKRGIGTIRQDINISILGHPRVEIKGFQDPRIMIKTFDNEVKRQVLNLKSNKELRGEVRNALDNGESEFLRPMPGSARMYPETDLPLLKISREIINRAKESLPKLRSEIRGELVKKGLSEEQVRIVFKQGRLEDFESLYKITDDPKFIFKALIEIPVELSRHYNKELDSILTLDVIESIVNAVQNRKIEKSDVKHVMEEIVSGKPFEKAIHLEKSDIGDVESEIVRIIKEKPGLTIGGYMGLIMQKFKGKISGKDASDILERLIR